MFSPKIINNEYYVDAFAVNNCPCNIFKNDLENTICLNMINETEYTNVNSFQSYIMNVFDSIRNYTQNLKIYKPKILINLSYNCSPIDFDLSKDILMIYLLLVIIQQNNILKIILFKKKKIYKKKIYKKKIYKKKIYKKKIDKKKIYKKKTYKKTIYKTQIYNTTK